MISIAKEFFSRSDLPAIPLLITPIVLRRDKFPIFRYLELLDVNVQYRVDETEYSSWKLYQLYTVLSMINERTTQLPSALRKRIVELIRVFIYGLVAAENAHQRLDSRIHPSDDDDMMEVQNDAEVRRILRVLFDQSEFSI